MLLGDDVDIAVAGANLYANVSKVSKREVFGSTVPSDWKDIFAKYFILEMIECSGGESYDDCELECLMGVLKNGVTNNCC
jgi:hypothetical protein